MANLIRTGGLPQQFHMVMDEAYPCSGQELSPWKGRTLTPAQDNFNYFLSLHRQVRIPLSIYISTMIDLSLSVSRRELMPRRG